MVAEMEKNLADKIKLRESTLDEIRMKFGEKVNEILEMNRSIRDSLDQQKSRSDTLNEFENRMGKMERRLAELNSAYDGVMKELLDQKSIVQELIPKKVRKEEPKVKHEAAAKEETKQPEKPKPKGEYIVAGGYAQKSKKKEQVLIEAEDKPITSEDMPEEKPQFKKPDVKRSERAREGVEIFETLKKR